MLFGNELYIKQLDSYYYFRLGLNLYEKVTLSVREKYGLSYMEFVVLLFIANNSEYKKASDIVEILGIAKSHVSETLNTLEEKGLVERKRDTQDKRSSILEVMERAKDIIEEGRRAQKEYHDLVFGSLSDDELKELGRLQKIIEKNIKENL